MSLALLAAALLPVPLTAEAGLILSLAAALALIATLDPPGAEEPPPEADTTAAIFALHGYV